MLVRYHVAISLDGFIAPKDGSPDWLEPYGKVAMSFIGPWMKNIGGIVVGRSSYDEAMQTGWSQWQEIPALVMTSRAMPKATAMNVKAAGDPAKGLAQLKARMGAGDKRDIWLFGGGVTAGLFLKAGLIDVIELAVVPVVLGAGRPLFSDTTVELTFKPAGSQPIGDGVVVNSYRKIAASTSPRPRSKSRG